MVSLADLRALTFPVYGPTNWLDCGRAIYACLSSDDGALRSLGLSHQMRVDGRIAHLGVETFAAVQPERAQASSVQRHVLAVDGTRHEVVFAVDQRRPMARFVHEGRTVYVETVNWPLDGLELVSVDATQYYEDSLLSHWLE